LVSETKILTGTVMRANASYVPYFKQNIKTRVKIVFLANAQSSRLTTQSNTTVTPATTATTSAAATAMATTMTTTGNL